MVAHADITIAQSYMTSEIDLLVEIVTDAMFEETPYADTHLRLKDCLQPLPSLCNRKASRHWKLQNILGPSAHLTV